VNYTDFVRRFPENKEIGRDINDEEVVVYCDNGTEVGTWRQNRRTTEGRGEVLSHDNADMARYWFRKTGAAHSR
jgi:hypothetical protein